MKKLLSIIIIAGLTVFAGCRKNDNPKLPEGINRTPLPMLTQDPDGDLLIQNVDDFKSKFSLDLYFKDDTKPKKMDLVVAMSGDYDNVKTLQADVTGFPVDVDVTGPGLAQLFGKTTAQVLPGDYFEIRANITLDNGTVLPGFIPIGLTPSGDTVNIEPYGGDAVGFPGSNLTIKYTVVCELHLEDFVGSYTLDDPTFWGASYPVTIALEGTDGLAVTGFVESPAAVIHLKVSSSTHLISVAKQTYLPTLPTTDYHNPSIQGSGEINACGNSITLNLTNTVDEGSFGSSVVKIHK